MHRIIKRLTSADLRMRGWVIGIRNRFNFRVKFAEKE